MSPLRERFSNPFIARELRTRWRHQIAFGVPFLASLVLAVVFVWVYSQSWAWYGYDGSGDNSGRLASLGRELFGQLGLALIFAAALVAPALTAGTLAYERQQGLLEQLQLAPLGALRIAVGKYLGAALYGGLVFLCCAPFMAFTLLMGGVAPMDVARMAALQLATGGFCAALGLAISAASRKPSSALGTAYVLVVVWIIGTYLALAFSYAAPWTASGWSPLFPILKWIAATNPFVAGFSLTSPQLRFGEGETWPFCLAFEFSSTLILLLVAASYLKRPLGVVSWVNWPSKRPRVKGDEGRRAGYIETPWTRWLRFSNPVLRREITGMFRVRRPSRLLLLAGVTLVPIGVFSYGLLVYNVWTARPVDESVWPTVWSVLLIGTMLGSAIKGAQTFSGEVERGTWEGLAISLLTPEALIWGKLLGPALIYLPVLLLAAPLLLPCLVHANLRPVPPMEMLSPFFALAGTGWFYAVLGLRISLLNKRSAAATGWTLAAALAILILPLFLVDNGPGSDASFLGLIDPFAVIGLSADPWSRTNFPVISTGIPFLLLSGLAGWILYLNTFDAIVTALLPCRAAITVKAKGD